MHDRIASSDEVKLGSERSFGLVFAVLFGVLGGYSLIAGDGRNAPYLLAVAVCFLVLAFAAPGLLRPLNRTWFWFGLQLSRITTPLVMGIIFFIVLTPIALIMRAMGKDPLRLSRHAGQATYWIRRDPPGPPSESLTKQF